MALPLRGQSDRCIVGPIAVVITYPLHDPEELRAIAPHQVSTATVLCTGAAIGSPAGWRERAATVRSGGIVAVLDGAAERWFGGGFADRSPAAAAALLGALRDTDAESCAYTCDALAAFDVTDRLPDIAVPVLAVAGADDIPTPPQSLQRIVSGVQQGHLEVLDGVGHLAPAEAPALVAKLIAGHCGVTMANHAPPTRSTTRA